MNLKLFKISGSSFVSPAHGNAHGKGGARATILSFCISVLPPSEKIAGGFQRAGKKEGCWGGGKEFLPARA